MTQLTIKATCDAMVTETWVYELPDDFALPTNDDELHDFVLEVLHSEGEWDGSPIPATFVSCENELHDENNRELLDYDIEED